MKACFSALSPEVIDMIMYQLKEVYDLAHLSYCSKQLYQRSIPFLYRDVNFVSTRTYGLGDYGESCLFRHLRDFTCLMLSRHELASYVRSLTMRDDFNLDYEDDHRSDREPFPATSEFIRDAASKVPEDVLRQAVKESSQSPGEELTWLRTISSASSDDALLALLIPNLPNLTSLDLMIGYPATFYWRMIRRASRNEKPFDIRPSLSALNSIMNTWYEEKYGLNCDLVGPYFDLPAMKSLYLFRLGDAEDECLQILQPNSSTVTHLELKQCKIPSPDLLGMLRAPKELETFVYEIGWGHLSYQSFSIPKILEGLRHSRSTLRNLWLGYEDQKGDGKTWWGHEDSENLTPMILKDFTHLARLRSSMVFLFDAVAHGAGSDEEEVVPIEQKDNSTLVDCVPPRLKQLHIDHTKGHVTLLIACLEKLLEHKADFLDLKEIIVEIAFHGEDALFETGRLETLASESGVVLRKLDTSADYQVGTVERGWGYDENIFFAPGINALNETPVFAEVAESKAKQEGRLYREGPHMTEEEGKGSKNWTGKTRKWPMRRRW